MTIEAIMLLITSLVKIAEGVFSKPKSGAEKKALVQAGANVVIETAASLSTGGQKNTWIKVGQNIGPIIDGVAGMLFPADDPESAINKMTKVGE